jgi:PAS domain S-box-containing protein/diguanylate cyclase (GGDEF)-like protein
MSELLEPDAFRRVMEDLQVGVYFTDRNRRIVFWNSGAERISGYLRQEVVGRCCRDNILMHCDHQQTVVCTTCCPMAEALADGKPREASLFLRHKAGHRIPVRIHTMPLRDASGAIIGGGEIFQRQRDVPHPERRDSSVLSNYVLTGIPDLGFMMSELRTRLGRLCEGGIPFGVLCMQVDHFEALRVNRGHEACETVIRVIANTMQNTIRPGDCLGTWSNSKLMLVLAATGADSLSRAGERLRGLVSCSNVVWWGDPLPITISIGGTLANPSDAIDSLVGRAERALTMSLDRGGDCTTLVKE